VEGTSVGERLGREELEDSKVVMHGALDSGQHIFFYWILLKIEASNQMATKLVMRHACINQ